MAALRYPRTMLTVASGSAFLLFLADRYLPSRNARNIPQAAHGHETSVAVNILNPRKQKLFQHRVTIEIPAARLKPGLGNDEILARFTRGFFGGWIFSPERWFFQLTGLSLTGLSGKYRLVAASWHKLAEKSILLLTDHRNQPGFDTVNMEKSPVHEDWDLETLPAKTLPPSGSLLFGNFLPAEKVSSAVGQPQTDLPFLNPTPDSARDFASAEFVAGGSDSFELISSHRFEVSRDRGHGEKEKGDLVTVKFSSVSCNSVTGRPYSSSLRLFHLAYARLLFADGVRAILQTK